jgi:NADH dehydrogenase/NADH:ubiquinone oxidoreductase subunit G
VLVSATATLEEMFACKLLCRARPGSTLLCARHVPGGVEDQILRKSDRHPNAKGAELLGLPVADFTTGAGSGDAAPGIGAPPSGAVLLAVGFDYAVGPALEKFLEGFSKTVVVSARASALTRKALVLIPGLTFAEKEGLVVNFEGHIQQLSPALDRLWDRVPPWQVVARLVAELTGESGLDTISGLRRRLAAEEPAFSAVDLNAVGPTGARVGRPGA